MYEGQRCPLCGQEFTGTDEIVVCPECGAPHHRKCYFEHGCCAYEEQHGGGFTFNCGQGTHQDEHADTENSGSEGNTERYCKRCGAKLVGNADFCILCGQSTKSPVTGGFMPRNYGKDPLGGEAPDAEIEGANASELAECVRINSDKYLPKFRRLSGRRLKLSWSWSAALFGKYYYFFRKMYIAGILLIVFGILATELVNLFMGNPMGKAYELLQPVYGQGFGQALQSQAQLAEILQSAENRRIIYACFVPMLAPIVLNVICAFFSNAVYLRRCIKKIGAAKRFYSQLSQSQIPQGMSYHTEIIRSGGVNIIGIFFAYFASSLISYFIDWLVTIF